jgi:hypothetical protein
MKLLHFGRVVVRVVVGCRSNYLRFCKDLAPAGCRKKKRSVCLSICGPGAEPWPKAEEGSAQGGSHPRCGTTSPQVSILMLAILMLVYLCIYHLRIMICFIGPSSMDAFSIQALIIYCFASKLYLLFLSSRNPDPLLSILMTSVSTLLICAQPDQPATQARSQPIQ